MCDQFHKNQLLIQKWSNDYYTQTPEPKICERCGEEIGWCVCEEMEGVRDD